MKNILLAGAIVTLLIPGPALAITGGPTLTVQPSVTTVQVGGQFTVTVQMDTKTYHVSAAELHLTFPSNTLQALSIATGSFLPNAIVAGSVGSGTATIVVGSGTQAVQGTGPIATVVFKALAAGSVPIALSSQTLVAATGQTGNVADTMTSATVTITTAGGSTPTPTATVYTTPTPYYAPVYAPVGTPTGTVGQVGQVSTGPLETTFFALIVSAIVTLVYVGYTNTDRFRRHEIGSIAKEGKKEPIDFRR